MTCKNQNKTYNMQFLQIFPIFVLLLVHFDCSQARLTRSSPIEDPLQPGYKRRRAKEAMKKGRDIGADVGAKPGIMVGTLAELALGPFALPITGLVTGPATAAGVVAGAGVGKAVGAAVGTVKACQEQIKAKLEQRSKKPIGLRCSRATKGRYGK
jgi:hypothetical protein